MKTPVSQASFGSQTPVYSRLIRLSRVSGSIDVSAPLWTLGSLNLSQLALTTPALGLVA